MDANDLPGAPGRSGPPEGLPVSRPDPGAAEATLLKYSGRVPRYTSYPTAPHFSPAIGPGDYRRWLGESDASQSRSLYFHVPFCQSLCWFCGCHTTVTRQPEVTRAYGELLVRELQLLAAASGEGGPISHVHWGGGTPTAIGPVMLRRIMTEARVLFGFAPEAELAIEIDPRTLTPETAGVLADLGFNRASLGVQDTDPEVQAAVNRIQPPGVSRTAAEMLRESGIDRINVDLMIGLPRQTGDGVRRSVAVTVDTIRPDRVSVFAYAHVPWMKRHQRLIDESTLPDARARLAQARIAEETLVALGYVPIGLDHFALADDPLAVALRQGKLHRNFQGYTVDQADILIGLGASSIGCLPRGYVQNAARVTDYRRAIEAGMFAVERGVALSKDDRVRRDIIERLMCDLHVDLGDVGRRWDIEAGQFDGAIVALQPFAVDGLVEVDGFRIDVPAGARRVIRSVCAVFDAYLDAGSIRHAAGI